MSEAAPKSDGHVYGRDQVVKIINSVISKVEGHEGLSREGVFKELSDLKQIIEDARNNIGSAKPHEIKDEHIPTATDELDEVVKATATATGAIMDACEVIEEKAGAIGGDDGGAIGAEVTKIYEACSFQDITGQRITNVISSIRSIEQKVDQLLSAIGGEATGDSQDIASGADDSAQGDEDLLNGPQMPDQAISQDDIDKLLAEFD